MHYPLVIGLGSYKITSHLLFESLAFIFGFRYYMYLRKRTTDKISDSNRQLLLIATIFGAFLFSRLIATFEHPQSFFESQNKLLYMYSNKTIVGALLGGLLFVEITKYFLKEKNSSGDLITYPLILAIVIGRIGCFTTGIYDDTYGLPTNFLTGINLGDGLLRHPTALYEIFYLLIMLVLLKFYESKYIFKDGYRFQIFMIFYLLFRFSLDFIKPRTILYFELSTIQLSCFVGLLYYSKTIVKLIFNRKEIIDGKKLYIL